MADKSAMITKGKEKYIESIRSLGGASQYRTCGAQGGMNVAVCLKGLKEALSESDWADRWEAFGIEKFILTLSHAVSKVLTAENLYHSLTL